MPVALRLSYLVEGVVRNYPDENPPNQQIWWTAVSSELTRTAPVRESTTRHTHQAVDPAQVWSVPKTAIEPTTTDNKPGPGWRRTCAVATI